MFTFRNLMLMACCGAAATAARAQNQAEPQDPAPLKSMQQEINPDTSAWFLYEPIDEGAAAGSAIDAGGLLHTPAGRHGRLLADGEDFAFEDGTPARFWGVNISAEGNFPDRATADHMARQLRRMGANLVRLHHLDANWVDRNIFGQAPRQSTRQLDPESMARLDYFVHQLRENGIYVYLDLLVTRELAEGDGVAYERFGDSSMKTEPQFGPELIELQKEYASNLLGHRNPHTGLTYAEDPAVVFIDVINEDSLFYINDPGGYQVMEGYYSELFQELFNQWLAERYESRAALAQAWSEGEGTGLRADEDPQQGTVEVPPGYRDAGFTEARVLDTRRFLYDTQMAFYQEMADHIRQTGYEGLITGSNHWTKDLADLHANARLDFVDRHGYWAHPSDGWRFHQNVRVDGRSMIESEWYGLIGSVTSRRVAGKPFTVSEWQSGAPNPWRNETLLIMPAYAAMQGWHGMHFNYTETDQLEPALNHVLNVYNQPGMMALWPAMARIFHRGDVAPATQRWFLPVTPEQALHPDHDTAFDDPGRYVTNDLSLLGKTGVGFTDLGFDPQTNDESLMQRREEADGVFRSTTGELTWDTRETLVTVDTPRTQGYAGFPDGRVQLGDASFDMQTPFAVVVLTTTDDQATIADADRLLLTAVARNRPRGMRLERTGEHNVRIAEPGDNSAILVEPVVGRVTVVSDRPVRVEALDASGRPTGELAVEPIDGGYAFDLAAEHQAMHYQITRIDAGAP